MQYNDFLKDIKDQIQLVFDDITESDKIEFINNIREFLHQHSPFKNEPVDFVKWVQNDIVIANDYNPNAVAPPEMELLEISILNDGYTQPIVTQPKSEAYGKYLEIKKKRKAEKEMQT